MSDVPEWLQRIRRQAYGSSRDAPRPRPPVQAQEPPPFPFPMRQEPEPDWERERREQRPPTGSVIGGMVGAMRPPPAQQQQGQRPSLLSRYANVIPWEGLGDLGGFLGQQAMRAPGRLMRGEPTNAMPPPDPSPQRRQLGPIGPPSQYGDGVPPPFPFPSGSLAMRSGVSFADVQDYGGGSDAGGELLRPAPRGLLVSRERVGDGEVWRQPESTATWAAGRPSMMSLGARALEPPSAPQEQTAYLSNEDPEWNAARGRVREQLAAEYRDNISRVPRPGNTTLNQAVAAVRRGPDDKTQRKGDGPIIGGGTLIPPRQVAQDQQDWMRGTNQAAPRVDPATGWPIDPVTGQPVAPLEWDRMQRQAAEQQRQDQERASRGNQWGVSDEGVTFRRRW